jgi:hypothetical protein
MQYEVDSTHTYIRTYIHTHIHRYTHMVRYMLVGFVRGAHGVRGDLKVDSTQTHTYIHAHIHTYTHGQIHACGLRERRSRCAR